MKSHPSGVDIGHGPMNESIRGGGESSSFYHYRRGGGGQTICGQSHCHTIEI